MKSAITADAHLKTYPESPERYHALRDIFEQSLAESVDVVVIIGDLARQGWQIIYFTLDDHIRDLFESQAVSHKTIDYQTIPLS